jgi:diadenosine tetraphosphatase ApaH/serine/threonine PP2A family protein phosphatase
MSSKRTRAQASSSSSPSVKPLALDSDIEAAIRTLMANWRAEKVFSEQLISGILHRARDVIMAEPMLARVSAPVNVCGDIHGQLRDLVSIMDSGRAPPQSTYLFLGDYVDRGKQGIECMGVLLGLKILHPKSITLLRGNHESASLTRQYGFYDECKRRFNAKLFKKFIDVFNCFPVAAVIDNAALCMHGGLSPHLMNLGQIEKLTRPYEIPEQGLICDLLWADPDGTHRSWKPSDRGVSHTFGADVVEDTLRRLDLDLIVRAHQVMDNGYDFFAQRRLVTIFSASNYCGEFTNCGAMLQMDADLKCSFQIFKPRFEKASFK